MAKHVRHKCFISYHHDDQVEVDAFIKEFDTEKDVFIARAVGVMDQDIIDSDDDSYIMRAIRERYLTDSTVTMVLIGKHTWSRKYVDWEIAATLRDDPKNKRSGLLAITLPSVNNAKKILPVRLSDNVDGDKKYAQFWTRPTSASVLANLIEKAFEARSSKASLVDNTRALFKNNRSTG